MRNLKVLPVAAPSIPVTGLAGFEPQNSMSWSPQGVTRGQVGYEDGVTPSSYGSAPARLHRAGRP